MNQSGKRNSLGTFPVLYVWVCRLYLAAGSDKVPSSKVGC